MVLLKIFNIFSSTAFTSVGGTFTSSSSTISGKQDVLEQITGVAQDIASKTGKPNPSNNDKYNIIVAPA